MGETSARGPTVLQYPVGAGGSITRVLEVPGAGAPVVLVVLVHGVGARADRWRTSLTALESLGHRAVALDLLGHGFATKGPGPDYSVPGLARFVGAVLSELDIDEAIFVGTSLGAHVLATLALERPSLSHKLVLVGPLGVLPLGPARRAGLAASIRDASREGIARKLGAVIGDAGTVSEGFLEEEYRINNSPGAAASFELLGTYLEQRLDDDAVGSALKDASSRLELMFVWGADDVIVPPMTAEQVSDAVGRARVVVVPRAAHAPYLEQTDEFWRLVGPFLSD